MARGRAMLALVSTLPPRNPDGTAPCKPCGRVRLTNDFGRCKVCGEAIARPDPRRGSLLWTLVWNNIGPVLLLAATAAILFVALQVMRAMPSGGAVWDSAGKLVREEPWAKPLLLGAAIAACAAFARLSRGS